VRADDVSGQVREISSQKNRALVPFASKGLCMKLGFGWGQGDDCAETAFTLKKITAHLWNLGSSSIHRL
jgi:hypothetical protein